MQYLFIVTIKSHHMIKEVASMLFIVSYIHLREGHYAERFLHTPKRRALCRAFPTYTQEKGIMQSYGPSGSMVASLFKNLLFSLIDLLVLQKF